jgi:hypothetical protein
MSRALSRWLPGSVVAAFVVTAAASTGIILFFDRPDWWRGLFAASIVSGIGGGVSIVILSRIAGRTVDQAVTYVMAAAAVRMGVSLAGLLVAVMGFKTPAEPTGFIICGYYAATLLAETTLLARATRARSSQDRGTQDRETREREANSPAEKTRGTHA